MSENYEEKREFLRVDLEKPLNFKTLKGEKLIARSDILSRNVSACGLLLRTTTESSIPALSSIVWIEIDDKIMNICAEIEEPMAGVALAWLLHQPGVTSVIVVARQPHQIEQTAQAGDLELSTAVVDELTAATDAVKQALGPNPDMWQSESRFR